jgi:ubiquinone biosynthesis protein
MVGELSEEQRADIISLIVAAIANDSATIARILMRMGTPTGRVDIAELRAEIERVRAKYLVVANLGAADTSGFAEEFAEAATKFRIKLAPEYAVLIKAAATVEGILRGLDPEVDLLGIARPYLQQVMARRFDPQRLLQGLTGELGGLATIMRGLPTQLDQILHDAQTGNMQVRAVTPELDRLPSMLHRATSRVTLALFAGATTVAAALLAPTSVSDTGRLVACGLLALTCAIPAWLILLGWHFVGHGKPVKVTPWVKLLRRS